MYSIDLEDAAMSRVQLALNVSDLDAAIAFYGRLFATEPAKVRPGYANFAIADPPLKLVLIEGNGAARQPEPPRRRGRDAGEVARRAAAPAGRRPGTVTEDEVDVLLRACRTRCGSTAPTASRGRSTRCCAMSRWPRATSGASTPTRLDDAAVLRRRARVRVALLLTACIATSRAASMRRGSRHRVPRRGRRRLRASPPNGSRPTTSGCSCSRTRSRPAPGSSR